MSDPNRYLTASASSRKRRGPDLLERLVGGFVGVIVGLVLGVALAIFIGPRLPSLEVALVVIGLPAVLVGAACWKVPGPVTAILTALSWGSWD